jgi:hypothetical protein
MLRGVGILLLALLAACGDADRSASNSESNAPAVGAQPLDAEGFKVRLQPRLPECARRTQATKGLSPADAESFCTCQLDVIAAKTTPEERDSLLKMTFQTETQKASPEQAKMATDALLRLQPEITRTCIAN